MEATMHAEHKEFLRLVDEDLAEAQVRIERALARVAAASVKYDERVGKRKK